MQERIFLALLRIAHVFSKLVHFNKIFQAISMRDMAASCLSQVPAACRAWFGSCLKTLLSRSAAGLVREEWAAVGKLFLHACACIRPTCIDTYNYNQMYNLDLYHLYHINPYAIICICTLWSAIVEVVFGLIFFGLQVSHFSGTDEPGQIWLTRKQEAFCRQLLG